MSFGDAGLSAQVAVPGPHKMDLPYIPCSRPPEHQRTPRWLHAARREHSCSPGSWRCLRTWEQPTVLTEKRPQLGSPALVPFVPLRQQWWNTTGTWQKLCHGVRFFLRRIYVWLWRARQTSWASLRHQGSLVARSQSDAQATSLAYGQDLWWNLSLPAGRLLAYTVIIHHFSAMK